MKRIIAILLLAALCAAGFSGCTHKPLPDPPVAIDPATPAVSEFRLGSGTMQEPAGAVTFPLDGLLGVPSGKSCPVVFILHGAHGVQDVTENRYYQGFSYLAQALTEQGYLTVCININRAFSFEPFEGNEYERATAIFTQYYDLLRRANDGERVFEADLTGKADLAKLNFIGHSRGGDDSLYIARQLRDAGDQSVQSVLLVASPLQVIAKDSYTDVPTGIILSQYDGDVTGLDTATLFNRAWFLDNKRQSPVSMAFLYGANHAQYNSAIAQADVMAPPENVTYLAGDVQREFLKRYATDFLNVCNRGADSSLLGSDASARYGIDFMPSLLLPGGETTLPDAQMSGITSGGMQTESAVFSQIPTENTLAPFYHPGALEVPVHLLRLSWDAAGQSVSIELPRGDWSRRKSLALLLANDPTSPANTDPAAMALEIALTDQDGNTASVNLNAQTASALRYLPTPVIDLFEGLDLPPYRQAQFHTPLSTQLLALSAFEGIDLSRIAIVTLRGASGAGACIFGGLRVH